MYERISDYIQTDEDWIKLIKEVTEQPAEDEEPKEAEAEEPTEDSEEELYKMKFYTEEFIKEAIQIMLPKVGKIMKDLSKDDITMRFAAYWLLFEKGIIKISRLLQKIKLFEDDRVADITIKKYLIEFFIETTLKNLIVSKKDWQNEIKNPVYDEEVRRVAYGILAEDNTKNRGQNRDLSSLDELLTDTITEKQRQKISDFVENRKTDTELACLLEALRRADLIKDCSYAVFHRALQTKFPEAKIGNLDRAQELFSALQDCSKVSKVSKKKLANARRTVENIELSS